MNEQFDEFDGDLNGAPSPSGEIRHGVRHLARDMVTLAELQANLLQVETRDWFTKVAIPALVLGVSAAVVALASLPILLLSFAYWLVDVAALSLPLALLAAGGVGLLVAIAFGLLAVQRIKRGRGAFAKFQLELGRNVRWLKQILGRPTAVADTYSPPPEYSPSEYTPDPFVPDAAPLRPR